MPVEFLRAVVRVAGAAGAPLFHLFCENTVVFLPRIKIDIHGKDPFGRFDGKKFRFDCFVNKIGSHTFFFFQAPKFSRRNLFDVFRVRAVVGQQIIFIIVKKCFQSLFHNFLFRIFLFIFKPSPPLLPPRQRKFAFPFLSPKLSSKENTCSLKTGSGNFFPAGCPEEKRSAFPLPRPLVFIRQKEAERKTKRKKVAVF